jgi:toxin HigB-1
MAIKSFRRPQIRLFFETGQKPKKEGWSALAAVVKRKLDMIQYAAILSDLKSPPNNQLEALKGTLKGFYSIRINDQWRVIFRWTTEAEEVDIVDYH